MLLGNFSMKRQRESLFDFCQMGKLEHLISKPSCFNPLLPGVPFLYPLKTSENLRFSDVFRVYKRKHRAVMGYSFNTINNKPYNNK